MRWRSSSARGGGGGINDSNKLSRPLGNILVEKGYLTDLQLAKLLEAQRIQTQTAESTRRQDQQLGRLFVNEGRASAEQINDCLRAQAEAAESGAEKVPRLGELIVDRGYATAEAVSRILAVQQKTILACITCGKRFNVSAYDPARDYSCPSCKGALEPTQSVDNVQVDATATRLPPVTGGQEFPPLGKYSILRVLGRGGMGVVYEALDTELNRRVALKLMLTNPNADPAESKLDEERFLREARLSANLPKHPHIVGVYEAGVIDGRRYIAMEFVPGRPMSEWRKGGSITIREQIRLLRDVSLAAHHAHEHGVIHRDLKPENILVDGKGQPHVTDFGLAKAVSQNVSLSLTAAGMIVGTPAYISPEQAQGLKGVDRRTDVYALGVMLYEILTGRTPFLGATAIEILMKAVKENVPPPSRFSESLDGVIETICLKSLAKNVRERYATADALAKDLTRWLKGENVKTVAPRPSKSSRPNTLAFSFAFAAAATVLVAIGIANIGDSAPDPAFRKPASSKPSAPAPAAGNPAVNHRESVRPEEELHRQIESAKLDAARQTRAEMEATSQKERAKLAAELEATRRRLKTLEASEQNLKAGSTARPDPPTSEAMAPTSIDATAASKAVSPPPVIAVSAPPPFDESETRQTAWSTIVQARDRILDNELNFPHAVFGNVSGRLLAIDDMQAKLDLSISGGRVEEILKPESARPSALLALLRLASPHPDEATEKVIRQLAEMQEPEPVGQARTKTPTSPPAKADNNPKFAVWLDRAKGIQMGFVRIPAGRYRRGSTDGESNEGPAHTVTLSKDFWMQTTEVTQAQWESLVGSNPSTSKGAELPVQQIAWHDCQDFVRELNSKCSKEAGGKEFRLPTEAEWEYACRAGGPGKWCFGDDESKLAEYAWFDKNSANQSHPVARKKPNAWGLYDMHGNVWEWCQDWFGPYGSNQATDPTGPTTGDHRVIRGGSWQLNAKSIRSAIRNWGGPQYRQFIGLRMVAIER